MADPETVRQAIERHNRDMSVAFDHGDAAAVAALTDPARLDPPRR
jgi:hypothetical protein